MTKYTLSLLLLLTAACDGSHQKELYKLNKGDSQQKVIQILGAPNSAGIYRGTNVWTYSDKLTLGVTHIYFHSNQITEIRSY